ncbi:capsule biosynthesis protein [Candidatus Thiothrix anitrata]|uniref:Capsule biosynthesis protein n=1 Tax=Candidatus Thiothrix anitrata TaxID=2823902 RepID=A0ABX7X0H4_9GAMM|nr:capsule biosynthesis protein [Candidatus Thiothrix anitrata]QTR49390.1 capsule biosynthesis protein [Candidatus Thiothrix anitrata]
MQSTKKLTTSRWLFIVVVILSTLMATVYFGLFASDVYISESRFVIRTSDKQTSPLDNLLQGAGFVSSTNDAYTVQSYILSRDALQLLDKEINLKEKFSDTGIDLFSRFNGFGTDDSDEGLYQYYQGKVTVTLDPTSSVVTLITRGFTAEDAHRINQILLNASEDLINKINERARHDTIKFSQSEVEEAEKKAKAAAIKLAEYQNKVGLIDPEKQAAIPLQQVAKLQDELLSTRTQILQIETLAPENPQLPTLRKHAAMLEKAIDQESSKITGTSDKSMANKVVEYHRLTLDKEFSDRQLASTLASLEQAKAEAQKQQLYLEHFIQPSVPDYPLEPRRLRAIAATLILGLIIWGIISILVAGVREHYD